MDGVSAAPDDVGLGQVRLEPDGLGVIGDGAVIVAFAVVGNPAIGVRLGIVVRPIVIVLVNLT